MCDEPRRAHRRRRWLRRFPISVPFRPWVSDVRRQVVIERSVMGFGFVGTFPHLSAFATGTRCAVETSYDPDAVVPAFRPPRQTDGRQLGTRHIPTASRASSAACFTSTEYLGS